MDQTIEQAKNSNNSPYLWVKIFLGILITLVALLGVAFLFPDHVPEKVKSYLPFLPNKKNKDESKNNEKKEDEEDGQDATDPELKKEKKRKEVLTGQVKALMLCYHQVMHASGRLRTNKINTFSDELSKLLSALSLKDIEEIKQVVPSGKEIACETLPVRHYHDAITFIAFLILDSGKTWPKEALDPLDKRGLVEAVTLQVEQRAGERDIQKQEWSIAQKAYDNQFNACEANIANMEAAKAFSLDEWLKVLNQKENLTAQYVVCHGMQSMDDIHKSVAKLEEKLGSKLRLLREASNTVEHIDTQIGEVSNWIDEIKKETKKAKEDDINRLIALFEQAKKALEEKKLILQTTVNVSELEEKLGSIENAYEERKKIPLNLKKTVIEVNDAITTYYELKSRLDNSHALISEKDRKGYAARLKVQKSNCLEELKRALNEYKNNIKDEKLAWPAMHSELTTIYGEDIREEIKREVQVLIDYAEKKRWYVQALGLTNKLSNDAEWKAEEKEKNTVLQQVKQLQRTNKEFSTLMEGKKIEELNDHSDEKNKNLEEIYHLLCIRADALVKDIDQKIMQADTYTTFNSLKQAYEEMFETEEVKCALVELITEEYKKVRSHLDSAYQALPEIWDTFDSFDQVSKKVKNNKPTQEAYVELSCLAEKMHILIDAAVLTNLKKIRSQAATYASKVDRLDTSDLEKENDFHQKVQQSVACYWINDPSLFCTKVDQMEERYEYLLSKEDRNNLHFLLGLNEEARWSYAYAATHYKDATRKEVQTALEVLKEVCEKMEKECIGLLDAWTKQPKDPSLVHKINETSPTYYPKSASLDERFGPKIAKRVTFHIDKQKALEELSQVTGAASRDQNLSYDNEKALCEDIQQLFNVQKAIERLKKIDQLSSDYNITSLEEQYMTKKTNVLHSLDQVINGTDEQKQKDVYLSIRTLRIQLLSNKYLPEEINNFFKDDQGNNLLVRLREAAYSEIGNISDTLNSIQNESPNASVVNTLHGTLSAVRDENNELTQDERKVYIKKIEDILKDFSTKVDGYNSEHGVEKFDHSSIDTIIAMESPLSTWAKSEKNSSLQDMINNFLGHVKKAKEHKEIHDALAPLDKVNDYVCFHQGQTTQYWEKLQNASIKENSAQDFVEKISNQAIYIHSLRSVQEHIDTNTWNTYFKDDINNSVNDLKEQLKARLSAWQQEIEGIDTLETYHDLLKRLDGNNGTFAVLGIEENEKNTYEQWVQNKGIEKFKRISDQLKSFPKHDEDIAQEHLESLASDYKGSISELINYKNFLYETEKESSEPLRTGQKGSKLTALFEEGVKNWLNKLGLPLEPGEKIEDKSLWFYQRLYSESEYDLSTLLAKEKGSTLDYIIMNFLEDRVDQAVEHRKNYPSEENQPVEKLPNENHKTLQDQEGKNNLDEGDQLVEDENIE